MTLENLLDLMLPQSIISVSDMVTDVFYGSVAEFTHSINFMDFSGYPDREVEHLLLCDGFFSIGIALDV
jgi:hypothetical protein